jgi:hypothetical protein
MVTIISLGLAAGFVDSRKKAPTRTGELFGGATKQIATLRRNTRRSEN